MGKRLPMVLVATILACAGAWAFTGCGCAWDSTDPICDEGDCGAARIACVSSCIYAHDYRRYVDADCVGGRQECPDGTVEVESCDD